MNSEETKHSHIYSICFDSTIWTQYQDSFHFYLLKSEIHNFCIKNCFFKSLLFKLIEILIPLSPWSFVVSGNWKKRQIMKDWETTVNSILFHCVLTQNGVVPVWENDVVLTFGFCTVGRPPTTELVAFQFSLPLISLEPNFWIFGSSFQHY